MSAGFPRTRPSGLRARLDAIGGILEARPWLVYLLLAVPAFPVLEMLVSGERAMQYAHDVFDDDIPRLFSIAADWRAFGPFLWDAHLTSGNALVAQFALPPVTPDVILSFVVPPFAAYFVNTALMIFVAGTAMHLFLRDSLRLPAVACFAGGIIACLSFWHYIYGYGALLLPLVLWSTDRAFAERPTRRTVAGAVLIVAFLLLSGQVQVALIDGTVALAYVLATAPDAGAWPGRITRLAGIWAVAAFLAAPILATQLSAIPDSQRTIWDLQYLEGGAVGPALATAALRYSSVPLGVPITGELGGPADIYGSWFPGAIALGLLAVSLAVPRPSRRARFALALLLILPLLDLAAVAITPLQEHLGLLRSFQFVRVRHLIPIAVAINVAIGLAWATGPDPIGSLGRRRRRVLVTLVAAAAGAIAIQAAFAAWHTLKFRGPTRWGWELAAVALAGGGLILLGAFVVAARRRPRFAAAFVSTGLAACLVVGLGAERLVFARAERALDGNLGTWADRVAPTSAQAFIAGQPGGGRVLSIGEHANRGLVAGLNAVDGYEAIYPLRYHELFGVLIRPHLAIDPAIARYYDRWGNRAYAFGPELDWPVANLLGVRWLYVRGQTLAGPGLVQRFAAGDVTVYENPAALPRAFVVHDVAVVPDRTALIQALAKASTDDLRARAYLATADAESLPAIGPQSSGGADPADSARLAVDTPDRITVAVHTARPGLLILADTFADGWVADVDGGPVTIVPADDALRGVPIPAGDHVVTFTYRPIVTVLGLAGALLAALALAGWVLIGRRTRRD